MTFDTFQTFVKSMFDNVLDTCCEGTKYIALTRGSEIVYEAGIWSVYPTEHE